MFSGPGTVNFGNASLVDTTADFSVDGVYVLRLTADDGEFSAFDDVTITVTPGNTAPVVNAGTDQTVSISVGASLDGSVSDDGLPTPALVTTAWSKFSGPGTVTFGDAALVDTTAAFSVDGVYVLRLTADDGELPAFDDVTITVTPGNTAPVVNAGTDQTVSVSVGASLDGSVTDLSLIHI